MNTHTPDREDIYEATHDLTCRLAYLVAHLTQKALRGKDVRAHMDVLAHSREALEVAPMFLSLPDEIIDQIETLVLQSHKLQAQVERQADAALNDADVSYMQQILLELPREIVELPAELHSARSRPSSVRASGARAS